MERNLAMAGVAISCKGSALLRMHSELRDRMWNQDIRGLVGGRVGVVAMHSTGPERDPPRCFRSIEEAATHPEPVGARLELAAGAACAAN
jgi:hypothetical protein